MDLDRAQMTTGRPIPPMIPAPPDDTSLAPCIGARSGVRRWGAAFASVLVLAGAWTSSAGSALRFVADSVADFAVCSGRQGRADWYYGYHRADLGGYSRASFIPFPDDKGPGVGTNDFWSGSEWRWDTQPPWTSVSSDWQHPTTAGGKGVHWAARRYVAPTNAFLFISYTAADRDAGGGDGVDAYVFIDGISRAYHSITNGNAIGFSGHVTNVFVLAGTPVDFVVGPKAESGYDGTRFAATITGRTASLLPAARYAPDFQGPTPKEGWQYLWNANGAITNPANYRALVWTNIGAWRANGPAYPAAAPAGYVAAWSTWGHPGQGTAQGSAVDRFVIAAFTVRKSATYAITDGDVRLGSAASTGIELMVRVNSSTRFSQVITSTNRTPLFVDLKQLASNDTVYVMVGPNGNHGSDTFSWDFTLSEVFAAPVVSGGAQIILR